MKTTHDAVQVLPYDVIEGRGTVNYMETSNLLSPQAYLSGNEMAIGMFNYLLQYFHEIFVDAEQEAKVATYFPQFLTPGVEPDLCKGVFTLLERYISAAGYYFKWKCVGLGEWRLAVCEEEFEIPQDQLLVVLFAPEHRGIPKAWEN